jgi:hypothetical protein
MKVVIDGIEYAPVPEFPNDGSLLSALEARFDSDAGDNITVRQYLFKLLETLWAEGEGFSSKRPFGNSGWEFDLYKPLVIGGFIKGTLDENGYVEDYDKEEADAYVFELISAIFFGVEP